MSRSIPAPAGNLRDAPLARVLSWARDARATGCVRFRAWGGTSRLYLAEGRPAGTVMSHGFRPLAQQLLDLGWIDVDALDRALAAVYQGRPMEQALVEVGALTQDRLQEALKLQEHRHLQLLGALDDGEVEYVPDLVPDGANALRLSPERALLDALAAPSGQARARAMLADLGANTVRLNSAFEGAEPALELEPGETRAVELLRAGMATPAFEAESGLSPERARALLALLAELELLEAVDLEAEARARQAAIEREQAEGARAVLAQEQAIQVREQRRQAENARADLAGHEQAAQAMEDEARRRIHEATRRQWRDQARAADEAWPVAESSRGWLEAFDRQRANLERADIEESSRVEGVEASAAAAREDRRREAAQPEQPVIELTDVRQPEQPVIELTAARQPSDVSWDDFDQGPGAEHGYLVEALETEARTREAEAQARAAEEQHLREEAEAQARAAEEQRLRKQAEAQARARSAEEQRARALAAEVAAEAAQRALSAWEVDRRQMLAARAAAQQLRDAESAEAQRRATLEVAKLMRARAVLSAVHASNQAAPTDPQGEIRRKFDEHAQKWLQGERQGFDALGEELNSADASPIAQAAFAHIEQLRQEDGNASDLEEMLVSSLHSQAAQPAASGAAQAPPASVPSDEEADDLDSLWDDPGGDAMGSEEESRARRQRLLKRAMDNMGGLPRHAAEPARPQVNQAAPPVGTATKPVAPGPPGALSETDIKLANDIERRHAHLQADDHFARLGLSRSANREQIKHAFIPLAKRYHPDMLPPALGHLSEKVRVVFEAIREAHDLLSDDAQRLQYLRSLESAKPDPSGGGNDKNSRKTVAPEAQVEARKALSQAELALRKKAYAEAESLFARAFSLEGAANHLAGQAWAIYLDPARKGDPKVQELLKRAFAVDASADRAHYVAGVVARAGDDFELADRHFHAALRTNPGHADASLELRLLARRREKGEIPGGPGKKKGFFGL